MTFEQNVADREPPEMGGFFIADCRLPIADLVLRLCRHIGIGDDNRQPGNRQPGNRQPEIGNRKSATGNRQPEIGNPEIGNPEIGNRKLAIGNRQSEIGNQK